jgi:hypothetical protein
MWGWICIEMIGLFYYFFRRLFHKNKYIDNVPMMLSPNICITLHIFGVCVVYIYLILSHLRVDTYSPCVAFFLFFSTILFPILPALFDPNFHIRSLSVCKSKITIFLSLILSIIACTTLFRLDIFMLVALLISLSLESKLLYDSL